jgi:hypothetical protein
LGFAASGTASSLSPVKPSLAFFLRQGLTNQLSKPKPHDKTHLRANLCHQGETYLMLMNVYGVSD